MSDSTTGHDRAPDRYTAHGRETIDRMRDHAHTVAADLFSAVRATDTDVIALADALFVYHCEATAMKYEDRKGLKGPADEDAKKAAFYYQMAAHIQGVAVDPRSGRAGFVAYARPVPQ